MKRSLLGCFLALALSTHAYAQFTAMMLHELCGHDSKAGKFGCDMWIPGFQSGLSAAQTVSKERRVTCLPNGFTGRQAKLIVMKFLNENPKVLHEPADVVAFPALGQTFPCPGSSN